jgi:hypothetical protein
MQLCQIGGERPGFSGRTSHDMQGKTACRLFTDARQPA